MNHNKHVNREDREDGQSDQLVSIHSHTLITDPFKGIELCLATSYPLWLLELQVDLSPHGMRGFDHIVAGCGAFIADAHGAECVLAACGGGGIDFSGIRFGRGESLGCGLLRCVHMALSSFCVG